MAKLAAYKCMLLGLGVSGVISIIAISLSDVLPSLLTTDATLQAMLTEMFPIVALGNVTMSMGIVCWTVVGAQGRYHLSTTVALTVSFVVTIPLGAIMTIGLNIDPQGLVFAVFMGYTITAMILFALILMSDWEKLSKKIQEQVLASVKFSCLILQVMRFRVQVTTVNQSRLAYRRIKLMKSLAT